MKINNKKSKILFDSLTFDMIKSPKNLTQSMKVVCSWLVENTLNGW